MANLKIWSRLSRYHPTAILEKVFFFPGVVAEGQWKYVEIFDCCLVDLYNSMEIWWGNNAIVPKHMIPYDIQYAEFVLKIWNTLKPTGLSSFPVSKSPMGEAFPFSGTSMSHINHYIRYESVWLEIWVKFRLRDSDMIQFNADSEVNQKHCGTHNEKPTAISEFVYIILWIR